MTIALKREGGVIGALELELIAARDQGVKEDGMRRAQRQIVDQHQEAARGGALAGEGEGGEGGEEEVDQ